jgi:two-component sensor histidine kinase
MFSVYRDITSFKCEEDEIKRALKEKVTMLKEIHHRVKNNLQIAASLLRLQSGYVKDEESRQYFQDSQNRIRSMAIVHEKLYRSDDFESIDLKLYVNRLIEDLIDSLNVNRRLTEVNTEIDDIKLELDRTIPIGLIINEIITNSFKYAFPKGKKGKVNLKISNDTSNHQLVINIGDNGSGLPQGFDPQKLNSLGIQLVYTLAEGQLSGNVKLCGKKGTKYEIIIPLKEG